MKQDFLLHDCPDYELHITAIEENAPSRRAAEKEAEGLLLAAALGEGTQTGHSKEGAPFIKGREELKISLSHSKRLCLLAIGKGNTPIGVDIENPRAQLLRVRDRFLSASEAAVLDATATPSDIMARLTRLWTVKEAVYKAALTPGLSLNEIETAPDMLSATARGKVYRLHTLLLPPDNQVAIAFQSSARKGSELAG